MSDSVNTFKPIIANHSYTLLLAIAKDTCLDLLQGHFQYLNSSRGADTSRKTTTGIYDDIVEACTLAAIARLHACKQSNRQQAPFLTPKPSSSVNSLLASLTKLSPALRHDPGPSVPRPKASAAHKKQVLLCNHLSNEPSALPVKQNDWHQGTEMVIWSTVASVWHERGA